MNMSLDTQSTILKLYQNQPVRNSLHGETMDKQEKEIDKDLLERAVQLWCQAQYSFKTMDIRLCIDIAKLCQEVRDEKD